MNAKIWAPLALAIVLGLTAALVARKALLRSRAAAAAAARTVPVTVANGPIQPGQELTRDRLTTAAIAASNVPAGAFTNPDLIAGRVSVVPIIPGQTILEQFLAPKGAGSGLQALVPSGMRAITIDVSESSGLAGMLIPGCHVDVVATSLASDNPDRSMSRTIVQNLQVVAVGQRLSGPRPEAERETALTRTVTLLATPHDSQAIDLAIATSRLRLVLRATGDASDVDDDSVLMADLRGGASIVIPTTVPQNANANSNSSQQQPTTQPAVVNADDGTERHVVRLIEGSRERQVIFKDKRPDPASESAATDNKPIEENDSPESDMLQ